MIAILILSACDGTYLHISEDVLSFHQSILVILRSTNNIASKSVIVINVNS